MQRNAILLVTYHQRRPLDSTVSSVLSSFSDVSSKVSSNYCIVINHYNHGINALILHCFGKSFLVFIIHISVLMWKPTENQSGCSNLILLIIAKGNWGNIALVDDWYWLEISHVVKTCLGLIIDEPGRNFRLLLSDTMRQLGTHNELGRPLPTFLLLVLSKFWPAGMQLI